MHALKVSVLIFCVVLLWASVTVSVDAAVDRSASPGILRHQQVSVHGSAITPEPTPPSAGPSYPPMPTALPTTSSAGGYTVPTPPPFIKPEISKQAAALTTGSNKFYLTILGFLTTFTTAGGGWIALNRRQGFNIWGAGLVGFFILASIPMWILFFQKFGAGL